MLGFAALAEVALAEIPGVIQAPTQVAPRAASKIMVIEGNLRDIEQGSTVFQNDPFILIVNYGTLLPLGYPVNFTFTSPIGVAQTGDADFSYVSGEELDWYRNLPFQPHQFVTYIAAPNEFTEHGLWQIVAQIGPFTSIPKHFRIAQLPDKRGRQ